MSLFSWVKPGALAKTFKASWMFNDVSPSTQGTGIAAGELVLVLARLGDPWNLAYPGSLRVKPEDEQVLILTQKKRVGFIFIDDIRSV